MIAMGDLLILESVMGRSKKSRFLETLGYLMLFFFSLRANIENNSAMIILVSPKDLTNPYAHVFPVCEAFHWMLN